MLINQGLSSNVAQRVSDIFSSGLLSPEELDDRAFEALREFNEEGALEVLDQFVSSDLSHVQNKSAFLCGVMKTYVTKGASGETNNEAAAQGQADETKIKALLERTGYTLDITTGQRRYGGPPPGWEGPTPGTGNEVSNIRVVVVFDSEFVEKGKTPFVNNHVVQVFFLSTSNRIISAEEWNYSDS